MHASLQFLIYLFQLRLQPRAHRLADNNKLSFPVPPADMGKPQEGERLRLSLEGVKKCDLTGPFLLGL
jgi:hypothetical protein